MIRNYIPGKTEKHTEYRRVFDLGKGTAGYSFPCDARGNLLELPDAAKENYAWCLTHPENFTRWDEVEQIEWDCREPASGTCACGVEIKLYDQYYGACQCPECGRWYNIFGQSLLPPERWTEDQTEEECI